MSYTIAIRCEETDEAEGETWFARVVELPGYMTEGDTLEEAAAFIKDAMAAWVEVALEDKRPIPEPKATDEYSGKFVVRLPKSLHRDIADIAQREGVSLNQWVNVVLSRASRGEANGSSKQQA